MVDVAEVTKILASLGALKYFPTEKAGQVAIVSIVCEMASDEEQVRWLVREILDQHDEWPGPRTLRRVFCSRFKPKDGIDPVLGHERPVRQITQSDVDAVVALKRLKAQ